MIDSSNAAQNIGNILSGAGTSTNGDNKLAADFDQFLRLLTTQLQNQDPLEPLDTHEFTQQLVEFAGVEQSIQTNRNIESLILLNNSAMQVASLGYIGKEIQAVSDTGYLKDGEMTFRYAPEGVPENLTIEIVNSDGSVVRTFTPEFPGKPEDIVWDGLDDNGEPVPDGVYGIKAMAVDKNNKSINVFTSFKGIVTDVRTSDGTIVLAVEDLLIDSSAVISVGEASTSTVTEAAEEVVEEQEG